MTKILKSKYKSSRRLGVNIWGGKNAFNTRNYRPGQHGQTTIVKSSDHGVHLKAKQTIKCHYGRITEKQFSNTFKKAFNMKGNTAENFAGLLERRFDMVVYRMNFAPTIWAARQLVSHGHFTINGKKANIPSMKLKAGDVVALRQKSEQVILFAEALKKMERAVPDYLTVEASAFSGIFVRVPSISEIPYPFVPDFNKVVEFYSR